MSSLIHPPVRPSRSQSRSMRAARPKGRRRPSPRTTPRGGWAATLRKSSRLYSSRYTLKQSDDCAGSVDRKTDESGVIVAGKNSTQEVGHLVGRSVGLSAVVLFCRSFAPSSLRPLSLSFRGRTERRTEFSRCISDACAQHAPSVRRSHAHSHLHYPNVFAALYLRLRSLFIDEICISVIGNRKSIH